MIYTVYVDLYLKDYQKLRIYVIYLYANPNQKEERIALQNELKSSISHAIVSRFKVIVMGDLNANLDTYLSIINNNSTIP